MFPYFFTVRQADSRLSFRIRGRVVGVIPYSWHTIQVRSSTDPTNYPP